MILRWRKLSGNWAAGSVQRSPPCVRRLPQRLMGQLAQSALDAGGTVTGVEPQFFVQQELQHDGLTELIVTKDMTERKTKMIELGRCLHRIPRRHRHAGRDRRGNVQGLAGPVGRALHPV